MEMVLRPRSLVFPATLMIAIVFGRPPSAWQSCTALADDYTFVTIDHPLAAGLTRLYGISGDTVVGQYFANGSYHGFSETGGVFTAIDAPLAGNGFGSATYATDISGSTIVGWSSSDAFQNSDIHGFTLTGGNYTTFDNPSQSNTLPAGIFGTTIVGTYIGGGGPGFRYSNGIFTDLNFPGASSTAPKGIDADTIVGTYRDSSNFTHGFAISAGTWATLDDPLAAYSKVVQPNGSYAMGVSGSSIVGAYADINGTFHGFIEKAGVYTTLDHPLAGKGPYFGTTATDISGNTIVGFYQDAQGIDHGFIATPIPEPSTLSLAGFAIAMLSLLHLRMCV